jgi:hypothetical protein
VVEALNTVAAKHGRWGSGSVMTGSGFNEIWSLDFMSDSLYQGRRFRTLNILDEGT